MRRSCRRYDSEVLEPRLLLSAFDISEVARLFPDRGPETMMSGMGESVAIEGRVAVVGAPSAASGSDSLFRGGAAFVFILDEHGTADPGDDTWGYAATLSPQLPKPGSDFGSSVAISGNTIIVGAPHWRETNPYSQEGAVFAFVAPQGLWTGNLHESARLTFGDAGFGFGNSLAIDGDTVVAAVSNYRGFEFNGSTVALTYQKPVAGWNGFVSPTAVLVGSIPNQIVSLDAVDIDAGTIVVGGFVRSLNSANSDGGLAAFVFSRPAAGWGGTLSQSALLTATDIKAGDDYPRAWVPAIAVRDRIVVVGAGDHDGGAQNAGAAVLFEEPAGGWHGEISRTALLVASVPTQNAFFGHSISIDDDSIAIAGFNNWNQRIGFSGYIFSRPTGAWNPIQTETVRLERPPEAATFAYGAAIGISNGVVIVGSRGVDGSSLESGAMAAYRRPAGGWASAGSVPINSFWNQAPPDLGRLTDLPYKEFGTSVAMDGDFAVVSSPTWNSDVYKQEGAVWVYRNAGTSWQKVASLRFRDPGIFSMFGSSVAIQGDTIVVGASNKSAVYVFRMPTAGWSGDIFDVARLRTNGSGVWNPGVRVDLDGDTIITAGYSNAAANPVAVFVRSGGQWMDMDQPSALLRPNDTSASYGFGASIAIHGHSIAVESPGTSTGNGQAIPATAYVFERPIGGWVGTNFESAKLIPLDGEGAPYWYSPGSPTHGVDIFDDVVVLAKYQFDNLPLSTRAFVFNRVGTKWSGLIHESAQLQTTGNGDYNSTGSVAVDKSRILVGTGEIVELFERPTMGWNGTFKSSAQLHSSDHQPTGNQIAISGDYVVLGSPKYTQSALNSGAVTIMALAPGPDFGDAPDSYGTRISTGANGGARHRATGPLLGAYRDSESDAFGVLDGMADDRVIPGSSDLDDEDGVQIGTLIGGTLATSTVVVSGSAGRLFAWIDFNRDGDFADAGEMISDGSQVLSVGVHGLTFQVPAAALAGASFARFRITTEMHLGFDGLASDGEVEDYPVQIFASVPVVVRPAPLEAQNQPIFDWIGNPNAVAYEIWLTHSASETVYFRNQRVVGTSFQPPSPLPIGNYKFWVRIVRPDNSRSNWSLPHAFRITTAPILQAPPLTHDRLPTLRWNSVAGAATYDLWFASLSTGQRLLLKEGISAATVSYTLPVALNAGEYKYWIRARDASGLAANWSLPAQFDVGLLVTPIPRSFDDRPLVDWKPEPDAVNYEIYVSGPGGLIQQSGITANTWRPAHALAVGNFRFWVRGKVAATGRFLPWSPPVDFSTGGRTDVTAPGDKAITSTPGIEWLPVTDAVSYRLQIQDRTTSSIVADRQGISGTTFQQLTILPDGQYRVWVQAVTLNGTRGVWSAGKDFVIQTSTINLPVTVLSASKLSNGQVQFKWVRNSGAASYEIYLTNEETAISSHGIAGTTFSPSTVLGDGTWKWWVRGILTGGQTGAWSTTASVTIGQPPAIDKVSVALQATFELKWTPVLGALSYEVYFEHVNTGEVMRYSNLTATQFVPELPVATGHYRAWVRAFFSTNNPGTWSLPTDFWVAEGDANLTPAFGEGAIGFPVLTVLNSRVRQSKTTSARVELPVDEGHPATFPARTVSFSAANALADLRPDLETERVVASSKSQHQITEWTIQQWHSMADEI